MGPGIIFADLSVAINSLPMIRGFRNTVLILDVHFSLTEPERIYTFDDEGDIDYGSEKSWEVAKFWADPEREARALAEVTVADVVTVPFQHLADVLVRWNRNVVVLPDICDLDSAVDFYSIFMWSMAQAVRRKMSLIHRLVSAPLVPFAKRAVRDRADLLRKKLIERGWT
jgi:hypothetical protein